MRMDLGFAHVLSGHDLGELDRRNDTVFALSNDRRLAYLNAAYDRFARENGADWPVGAWDIGASIDEVIPEPLRAFYDRLYESARATGSPVDHDYECSSPIAIRKLRMRVYPLSAGWLVVNAIVAEGLDPGVASPPDRDLYQDARGIIVACCHCRRIRRANVGGGEQWDWVPAWVAHAPEQTSHGLCPPCFGHHYPWPSS